ncbi:MAG: prepilin peptidase [Myxococcota bacterium]
MQETLLLHGSAVVVAVIAGVSDFRTGKIPNWLTLPPLLIGPLVWGLLLGKAGFIDSVLGIFVCGLVPLVMWFVKVGQPAPQAGAKQSLENAELEAGDEDDDENEDLDGNMDEDLSDDEADDEYEEEEDGEDRAAVAMHGGDVKLFAALGALAGWNVGLRAELLAFILAAVFAMAALAWRGRLFATLLNVVFLAVNPFLPKRRRRPMSSENMSTIRMGVAAAMAMLISAAMAHPLLFF